LSGNGCHGGCSGEGGGGECTGGGGGGECTGDGDGGGERDGGSGGSQIVKFSTTAKFKLQAMMLLNSVNIHGTFLPGELTPNNIFVTKEYDTSHKSVSRIELQSVTLLYKQGGGGKCGGGKCGGGGEGACNSTEEVIAPTALIDCTVTFSASVRTLCAFISNRLLRSWAALSLSM
jgi:hypothetical protein